MASGGGGSSRYERVPLAEAADYDSSEDGVAAVPAAAAPAPSLSTSSTAPPPPPPPVAAAAAAAQHNGGGGGGFVANLVANIQRLLAGLAGGGEEGAAAATPAARARAFAEHLRSRYLRGSERPLPALYAGSVEEALEACDRQLRPLLVYLHSEEHDDTAAFVGGTLADPALVRYIDDHFIVWGASASSPEGYAACNKFGVAGFPFVAVYATTAPATRGGGVRPPAAGTARFRRVWGHEGGAVSADALRGSLTAACETVLTTLDTMAAERAAVANERRLREEQERDYRESEARDRERARKRAADAAAAEAAAAAALRDAAAAAAAEEEARELADAIALSKELHKETVVAAARRRLADHPEPAATTKDISTLRLTLPSGAKLARRFLAADPLQAVYDYIVVASTELGAPLHHFDFGTNYPRRTFTPKADFSQSLRSAGLFPQAMVFVSQSAEQAAQDKLEAAADDGGEGDGSGASGGGGAAAAAAPAPAT